MVKRRRMTNAELQARWRLRHDRVKCTPNHPPGSAKHVHFIVPEMLVTCIPRGNVDIDELVASSHHSMALYNKMIARVERWLDLIEDEGIKPADVIMAYRLLTPILESLVTIRGKISEQRADEAKDVTGQMQIDLQEGLKRESPRIAETLALMRDRFSEIRREN